MKKSLLLFLFCLPFTALCQNENKEKKAKVFQAKAACGQCQLELPGYGCDLAVVLDNKAYFVVNGDIDAHGDAHADDGLCNAIRDAEVSGEVIEGKFKATFFKLLPLKNEKKE
ncbi:DUF6370 family protein [Flavobacterium sp. UBA6135]|uniref:DUF6370 family protein n=1 Tax=Flavobacterium sp. UBA6135 TaxID=1946553 RepID=UPI0025C071CC|nr:DUF6370 family protein [Flavobacterium sp. UBA6135]